MAFLNPNINMIISLKLPRKLLLYVFSISLSCESFASNSMMDFLAKNNDYVLANTPFISAFYEDYHYDSNNKDRSDNFGLATGIALDKDITLRLNYANQNAATKNRRFDSGNRIGIDALYQFQNLPFYAILGVNRSFANNDNLVNGGLGVNLYRDRKIALSVEGNYYKAIGERIDAYGTRVNLVYYFGSEPKIAESKSQSKIAIEENNKETQPTTDEFVSEPSDQDLDGVVDISDHCPNTSSGQKVDENGCAPIVKPKKVQLKHESTVYFKHSSFAVDQKYLPEIENVANKIKDDSDARIAIEAYASKDGSKEANLLISQKRAEEIKKILVEKFQIEESRISILRRGISSIHPSVAKNRFAFISITYNSSQDIDGL